MKKLFIFMAALLPATALFAQQPVKQISQPPVQVHSNLNLQPAEAQHVEQFVQMQEVLEQQNATLPQERVLILPVHGAIKPYLIMHK